jgi:hypothetical protein
MFSQCRVRCKKQISYRWTIFDGGESVDLIETVIRFKKYGIARGALKESFTLRVFTARALPMYCPVNAIKSIEAPGTKA